MITTIITAQGQQSLISALHFLQPFRNQYGTLIGKTGKHYDSGQLKGKYLTDYQAAEPDYTVTSFSIPIAWHLPSQEWVFPAYNYDEMTGRHQRQISDALARLTRR